MLDCAAQRQYHFEVGGGFFSDPVETTNFVLPKRNDTLEVAEDDNAPTSRERFEHRLRAEVQDGGGVDALLRLEIMLRKYQADRSNEQSKAALESVLRDCYEDLYIP
mgnify:FL=1